MQIIHNETLSKICSNLCNKSNSIKTQFIYGITNYKLVMKNKKQEIHIIIKNIDKNNDECLSAIVRLFGLLIKKYLQIYLYDHEYDGREPNSYFRACSFIKVLYYLEGYNKYPYIYVIPLSNNYIILYDINGLAILNELFYILYSNFCVNNDRRKYFIKYYEMNINHMADELLKTGEYIKQYSEMYGIMMIEELSKNRNKIKHIEKLHKTNIELIIDEYNNDKLLELKIILPEHIKHLIVNFILSSKNNNIPYEIIKIICISYIELINF